MRMHLGAHGSVAGNSLRHAAIAASAASPDGGCPSVPSWPRDTSFSHPIRLRQCYLHACVQRIPSFAVWSICPSGLTLSSGYPWCPRASWLGQDPAQSLESASAELGSGFLFSLSPVPLPLSRSLGNQHTKLTLPCTLQRCGSLQTSTGVDPVDRLLGPLSYGKHHTPLMHVSMLLRTPGAFTFVIR